LVYPLSQQKVSTIMLTIENPTTFLTDAACAASVAHTMKANAGLVWNGFAGAFARRPSG
jgi:hypothetical protein